MLGAGLRVTKAIEGPHGACQLKQADWLEFRGSVKWDSGHLPLIGEFNSDRWAAYSHHIESSSICKSDCMPQPVVSVIYNFFP